MITLFHDTKQHYVINDAIDKGDFLEKGLNQPCLLYVEVTHTIQIYIYVLLLFGINYNYSVLNGMTLLPILEVRETLVAHLFVKG